MECPQNLIICGKRTIVYVIFLKSRPENPFKVQLRTDKRLASLAYSPFGHQDYQVSEI